MTRRRGRRRLRSSGRAELCSLPCVQSAWVGREKESAVVKEKALPTYAFLSNVVRVSLDGRARRSHGSFNLPPPKFATV